MLKFSEKSRKPEQFEIEYAMYKDNEIVATGIIRLEKNMLSIERLQLFKELEWSESEMFYRSMVRVAMEKQPFGGMVTEVEHLANYGFKRSEDGRLYAQEEDISFESGCGRH